MLKQKPSLEQRERENLGEFLVKEQNYFNFKNKLKEEIGDLY